MKTTPILRKTILKVTKILKNQYHLLYMAGLELGELEEVIILF